MVAYNSLMDVDDMPAAVHEASRVLAPGGRLGVCVTHPTADAGKFASKEPDAPFVIDGSYLGRHRFEDTLERDGLQITFTGWRYSLEEYTRAPEDAGSPIEPLRGSRPLGVRLPRLLSAGSASSSSAPGRPADAGGAPMLAGDIWRPSEGMA